MKRLDFAGFRWFLNKFGFRFCVCCGEERCRIGYEEKEVLDMEPVRYFVRVIKREKLACRKCPEGGVVTAAAGGPKFVEKGKLCDAVASDNIQSAPFRFWQRRADPDIFRMRIEAQSSMQGT